MPEGKFKLSDTLKFLSQKLNKIVGHASIDVAIVLHTPEVEAGHELDASVKLRNSDSERTLDYLALTMSGQVQRDGTWQEYTEAAEVAQNMIIPPEHELVIPLKLFIPQDAVLSEDGASWSIQARGVLDRSLDPRDEAVFIVLPDTSTP